MSEVKLPAIINNTNDVLDQLTTMLGVPRDLVASASEIQSAWNNLPEILNKIPPALRNEGMVRMCIAVSCGLFDSAINYVWNTAIIELREKIRRFGLNVVQQITTKAGFDEET